LEVSHNIDTLFCHIMTSTLDPKHEKNNIILRRKQSLVNVTTCRFWDVILMGGWTDILPKSAFGQSVENGFRS
jgi:hypothetical protein